MTSEEYHAKRKEVLERFGDFDKMTELTRNNVYMDKIVSCLIYQEGDPYSLILDLLRTIDNQSEHIKKMYQSNSYPIIIPNERT